MGPSGVMGEGEERNRERYRKIKTEATRTFINFFALKFCVASERKLLLFVMGAVADNKVLERGSRIGYF